MDTSKVFDHRIREHFHSLLLQMKQRQDLPVRVRPNLEEQPVSEQRLAGRPVGNKILDAASELLEDLIQLHPQRDDQKWKIGSKAFLRENLLNYKGI